MAEKKTGETSNKPIDKPTDSNDDDERQAARSLKTAIIIFAVVEALVLIPVVIYLMRR
ncbi:MAG TPA: hypothetical protein VFX96_17980 [Pyrinomonadaceae bacterium]|nr:hypothetical protein [Pyrinomonadaceae bacterium]